jgi:glycosyltransferase AcbS
VNVVECHLEFGGFDDRLVKGGISVYLWNLCRALRRRGTPVSALTASHGLLTYLRQRYTLQDLGWHDRHEVDVPVDPVIWPRHGAVTRLHFATTAYRFRVADVDITLLDDPLLRSHPDTFYPPYDAKGRDLTFLKPLAFQVAAARYLRANAEPGTVVHLHEPLYHYLLPAILAPAGVRSVCTVQSNMPVNKKVYGPEVRALLRYLGASPQVVSGIHDPALDTPRLRAIRAALPLTKLFNEYPERPGHDYVSLLGVVAATCDALDFLSPGQLEHVVTQVDTPVEELFQHLAVRRVLRRDPQRLVVGGCAIGDSWFRAERDPRRRKQVLTGLGLDPALPTVFHNARYAVDHKGQHEAALGLRAVLESGHQINALLHCLSARPLQDAILTDLVRDFPGLVRLQTRSMTREELEGWALASDLCLYPSKFEMDTFLLGMGEAMACGAIPIATAQAGMRHFGHSPTPEADPDATGLALPRSFRADDPLLVEAVREGLERMLRLLRDDPDTAAELRDRARRRATTFTWERVAERFWTIFDDVRTGSLPAPDPVTLIDLGWWDLLSEEQLREVREYALRVAVRRGDADLVVRAGVRIAPDGEGPTWGRLFEAARRRCDVAACERIAEASGSAERAAAVAGRGRATAGPDGIDVSWSFTSASRVEAVIEGEMSLVPLDQRPDGTYCGRLARASAPGVALLISLGDGRTTWDWLEMERNHA